MLLVKLKGSPFKISIIVAYASTSGNNEESISKFYEELDAARFQCKSQEIIIVMGDLNAKVGCKGGDSIGIFGLSAQNDRG